MLSVPIRILRLSVLLILVIMVLFFFNSLNNDRIVGFFAFSKQLDKKIDHSIELVNAAKKLSGSLPSSNMHSDKINAWFYRFDENLEDANIKSLNGPVLKSSSGTIFSFDDADSVEMKPTGNRFSVNNGIISYQHSINNILTNASDLSLSRDDIGDIQLRIKVAHSNEIQLVWSALSDAEFDDYGRIEQIKISLIPDGQFHVYRVPDLIMASWLHDRGRTIRRLYLLPMKPETVDNIEIDYIRFSPKDNKFAGNPFGSDYEKVNAEMRKILYLHSGHELTYNLKVPRDQNIFFQCGLASLNDTPIHISMIIQGMQQQETIFSRDLDAPRRWQDIKTDLSSFAGQDVSISFQAKSDSPNVVFFSSPILYSPVITKQNIMIVLEDALRADHMSCYGNERETTPLKDKWREQGITFRKAFSQSSFTRSSCASFLTSLYPSSTGVWNNADRLSDNYTTIAEILYQHGFATALFSQNTNVGPFSGLHQGFGVVIDNETIGKRAPGIYKSDVLKKWIAAHADQNTFIFLHVLDPHYPFDPPPEVSAPYRNKTYLFGNQLIPKDKLYDPPWLKRVTVKTRNFLYDEEIRYNDLYFQSLINLLKDQKIYDKTLMVFMADHGEHMGEHYLWNHQPPNYQNVLHIPLIMVYPDEFPSGLQINQTVQLLDIMPTLLDSIGIDLNSLLIQGDSLLPYIRQDKPWSDLNQRICLADEVRFSTATDLYANGGIFYKQFHIMSSDRHADLLSHKLRTIDDRLFNFFTRIQVFDINSDPDETQSMLNFMLDYLFTYKIQCFNSRFRKINLELHRQVIKGSSDTVIYDNSSLEQLRSLGYVQ